MASDNFYYQNYHFHLFVNNAKNENFSLSKGEKVGGQMYLYNHSLSRATEPTYMNEQAQPA